jgi:ribosomal protein L22
VTPRENPPRDEGARDKGAKQEAEAAEAKQVELAETPADEVSPKEAAVEAAAPEDEAAAEDAGVDEEAAEDEVAEEETVPEEPAAEDEAAPEDEAAAEAGDEPAKPARRRGSAETGAAAAPRRPAPTRPDGAVVIRASAKYVRSAPRKARLLMDHIRGRPVEQARALLAHTPRAVSADIIKLLDSAVANAESNYELAADELRIERAFVDAGPIIKRYRPRALGRATRINKRTSHMTIELTTTNSEGA